MKTETLDIRIQYLPPPVTEVPRNTIRSYNHSKRVGNYLVGKTLGEGSFAKVKEGLHVLTAEKVAVKMIDKRRIKDDSYVRRNLRREGRIMQLLRHPHIVQLYEILETEHTYYLVLELSEGGELMDHICRRKRLGEREVKKYMKQIMSAVDYMHQAGVIHRDLKIENLLLDHNRDIKIIDFGLSNNVRVPNVPDANHLDHCITQCGSPAYAAPELLGHHKYGTKIDVWSIGINMYAMLTGSLPFTTDPFNIKKLHSKMITGQMNAMPPHLSSDGKDFLLKLLTPDPIKRPTIREAINHPWFKDDNMSSPINLVSFPNRLKSEDLNMNVLRHMTENMVYKQEDVVRYVVGNAAHSTSGTYHLLQRRLNKYVYQQQLKIMPHELLSKLKQKEVHKIPIITVSTNDNKSTTDDKQIIKANKSTTPQVPLTKQTEEAKIQNMMLNQRPPSPLKSARKQNKCELTNGRAKSHIELSQYEWSKATRPLTGNRLHTIPTGNELKSTLETKEPDNGPMNESPACNTKAVEKDSSIEEPISADRDTVNNNNVLMPLSRLKENNTLLTITDNVPIKATEPIKVRQKTMSNLTTNHPQYKEFKMKEKSTSTLSSDNQSDGSNDKCPPSDPKNDFLSLRTKTPTSQDRYRFYLASEDEHSNLLKVRINSSNVRDSNQVQKQMMRRERPSTVHASVQNESKHHLPNMRVQQGFDFHISYSPFTKPGHIASLSTDMEHSTVGPLSPSTIVPLKTETTDSSTISPLKKIHSENSQNVLNDTISKGVKVIRPRSRSSTSSDRTYSTVSSNMSNSTNTSETSRSLNNPLSRNVISHFNDSGIVMDQSIYTIGGKNRTHSPFTLPEISSKKQ